MKIPNYLSHKPILKLEDYSKLDGRFANQTDAEGLSIGLAQWSNAAEMDLSAKVWRYTGKKWSRQSEELPLHRVLDLASLLCAAMIYIKTGDLPDDKSFPLTLAENSELMDILKEGIAKENKNGDLDKSLNRLSEYIKDLRY